MSQRRQPPPGRLQKLGRRAARLAAALGAILILIAAAGFGYQSVSQSRDLRRYLPPGRLVDVGGFQLHLHCVGGGNPTVILESGLAGPARQWALVQQSLSQKMRVCAYDRAGLGWSDAGPQPRTSQAMSDELHTLLRRAGIEGPYVLVGHSLGAFNVRLFAHDYPGETLGVVLVAGSSENDDARMPPEYQKIEQSNLRTDRLMIHLTRFGLTRAAGSIGLLPSYTSLLAHLPPDLDSEISALTFYRPQYWETAAAELAAVKQSKAQVAAAGSLGNLPLVVLSGLRDVILWPPSFPVEQIEQTFEALQVELAGLSTDSTHIVCELCDHYIPMTDPDVVVDAINQLLAKIQP